MDRIERLRLELRTLGSRASFVDEPPSPAGIVFLDDDGFVCHLETIAVMADALSNPDFEQFVAALILWAGYALQFAGDGHDSGLAGVLAREALLERFPHHVVILDSVFDL